MALPPCPRCGNNSFETFYPVLVDVTNLDGSRLKDKGNRRWVRCEACRAPLRSWKGRWKIVGEKEFKLEGDRFRGDCRMIPRTRFMKLRLSQFMPKEEITPRSNWEFMDKVWVGEAVGLSEWLRLNSDPEALGSISLDFASLPKDVVEQILQELELLLRPGMNTVEIEAILGCPHRTLVFTQDRKTCEFAPTTTYPYAISCTVHESKGLIYLVVTDPAAIGGKNVR